MKNWFLVILSLVLPVMVASAQTMRYEDYKKQQNKKYDGYITDNQRKYDEYRRELNNQYAEFMKKNWESFAAKPAVDVKPVPPVVPVDTNPSPTPKPTPVPETKPTPKPIPVQPDVLQIPKPKPQPKPIVDVKPKEDLPYTKYSIPFYGMTISVGFPKNDSLRLNAVSEKACAAAWKTLSANIYDITLSDVLKIRQDLSLCDWAYVELIKAISEKKYGVTNEASMMQAYLLAQSGYKIRLAHDKTVLYVLVASEHGILSRSYYSINGVRYFPLVSGVSSLYICQASFEGEKELSLLLDHEQKWNMNPTAPRILKSKLGIEAQVSVNKHNIDFYINYPKAYFNNDATTTWVVYANTPMEKTVVNSLYPALRAAIQGMNEKDAVELILNFVQTAFEYGYDDKIWGCERPFFASETLYYPYSDCEDRSILFSRLVRDLIQLDVVLLYYPNHLATAVAFTKEVSGDYFTYNNKRFVVCDPTSRGGVGRTMPGMDNQQAKIVVL